MSSISPSISPSVSPSKSLSPSISPSPPYYGIGLIITYTPWGTTTPVNVILPGSMFGEESGLVGNSIDFQIAMDGTGNSYRAFNKRRKVLKWDYLTTVMKQAIEGIWANGGLITVADTIDPVNQFTGYMLAEPKFQQDFHGIWSGQVEVQQL